jgi:hypothetical protein
LQIFAATIPPYYRLPFQFSSEPDDLAVDFDLVDVGFDDGLLPSIAGDPALFFSDGD